MPSGTKPQEWHLPRRTRIISNLSLCVVVVKAVKRSGSLTTARFSAEQGRDILAMPGSPPDPKTH
jgi:DNA processing protein